MSGFHIVYLIKKNLVFNLGMRQVALAQKKAPLQSFDYSGAFMLYNGSIPYLLNNKLGTCSVINFHNVNSF